MKFKNSILHYTSGMSKTKKIAIIKKNKHLTIPSVDKDVKQLEVSYVVSGNTKWYNYYGKYFGGFL